MPYEKSLDTMCKRCINYDVCRGTGCGPRKNLMEALELIKLQKEENNALIAGQETLQKYFVEKMDRIVERLEKEKYRGLESLEPVLISFNFGINKAIDIVKEGAE